MFATRVLAANDPRAADLRRQLETAVGDGGVLWEPGSLAAYDNDAFLVKARALAVCLPETTAQIAESLRIAASFDLPVTPRGAGTGLSGGATAIGGGMVIAN